MLPSPGDVVSQGDASREARSLGVEPVRPKEWGANKGVVRDTRVPEGEVQCDVREEIHDTSEGAL